MPRWNRQSTKQIQAKKQVIARVMHDPQVRQQLTLFLELLQKEMINNPERFTPKRVQQIFNTTVKQLSENIERQLHQPTPAYQPNQTDLSNPQNMAFACLMHCQVFQRRC